jgi:hypothetical protein
MKGMAGEAMGMAGIKLLPGELIRESKLRLILEIETRGVLGRRASI